MKKMKIPLGWSVRTGLNPDFVLRMKYWAKERGRLVAEARKTGNVDEAIKALAEGKTYKTALKNAFSADRPYFVYDTEGNCIYIFEYSTTKKWQLFSAE